MYIDIFYENSALLLISTVNQEGRFKQTEIELYCFRNLIHILKWEVIIWFMRKRYEY